MNDPIKDNDTIEGHLNIDWYPKRNNVRLEKEDPTYNYFQAQVDHQNYLWWRSDLRREWNSPKKERTSNHPTTKIESESKSPPVILKSQLDNSYIDIQIKRYEIFFDSFFRNNIKISQHNMIPSNLLIGGQQIDVTAKMYYL